jgi:hypothetical protein
MTDKKPGLFSKLFGTGDKADSNRQHQRHFDKAQLTLRIQKKTYKTLDWSVGGFRINMADTRPQRGDILEGEIIKGIRGIKDKMVAARVARVNDNGDVGLQITEISHEAFGALSELQHKD